MLKTLIAHKDTRKKTLLTSKIALGLIGSLQGHSSDCTHHTIIVGSTISLWKKNLKKWEPLGDYLISDIFSCLPAASAEFFGCVIVILWLFRFLKEGAFNRIYFMFYNHLFWFDKITPSKPFKLRGIATLQLQFRLPFTPSQFWVSCWPVVMETVSSSPQSTFPACDSSSQGEQRSF